MFVSKLIVGEQGTFVKKERKAHPKQDGKTHSGRRTE